MRIPSPQGRRDLEEVAEETCAYPEPTGRRDLDQGERKKGTMKALPLPRAKHYLAALSMTALLPFGAIAQVESAEQNESFFNQDYVNHAPEGAPKDESDQEQFRRRELPSQEVAGSSAVKKGFERPRSPSNTWERRPPVTIYPNEPYRKPPTGVFESFESDYRLRGDGSDR